MKDESHRSTASGVSIHTSNQPQPASLFQPQQSHPYHHPHHHTHHPPPPPPPSSSSTPPSTRTTTTRTPILPISPRQNRLSSSEFSATIDVDSMIEERRHQQQVLEQLDRLAAQEDASGPPPPPPPRPVPPARASSLTRGGFAEGGTAAAAPPPPPAATATATARGSGTSIVGPGVAAAWVAAGQPKEEEQEEEDDEDEGDETQALLKISHDNKVIKACIQDLQDQVKRLQSAQNNGGGGGGGGYYDASVDGEDYEIEVRYDPDEDLEGQALLKPEQAKYNNNNTKKDRKGSVVTFGSAASSTTSSIEVGGGGHDDTDEEEEWQSAAESAAYSAAESFANRGPRDSGGKRRRSTVRTMGGIMGAAGRPSRAAARSTSTGSRASASGGVGGGGNKTSRTTSKDSRASTVGGVSRASTIGGSRVSTAVATVLDDEVEHLDQHLSEDTFGFLLASPFFSSPFYLALFVLLFQVAIYILMATNLLNRGNPSNVFSIPGNVTEAVWVAQVIAIVIAVITQDDIRTGLDMLREGYSIDMQEVFIHSNRWKYALSITGRLIGGSLGLMVNFLLIVTSSTVIDLLLNFTALAFVGQLDEAAFFLCRQGFAGPPCLQYATLVSESHYEVPKTHVMARKAAMMVIILLVMMVAWGYVRFSQAEGVFLCSTILVQLGDEMRPELGTFSGLYDLQNPDTFGFISKHVTYTDRAEGNTRFGYCDTQQFWTLQYKESPQADFPADPCVDWKARSASTTTFEITKAAQNLAWYVRDDFSREVVLDPFFLHCFDCGNTFDVSTTTTAQDCGGRGTCSDAVCTCDEGWYGLRCEFRAPCSELTLDSRVLDTFLVSSDVAHHLEDEGFEILMDHHSDPPTMMEAYDRPIFVGHLLHGHHMIIFYTGRRWVTTHTGLLPGISLDEFGSESAGLDSVLEFFRDFHGHWSTFGIEFITEPMDWGTPIDSSIPEGLLWYEAEPKSHINETQIQRPNLARPSEVRLLCAVCDNTYNPCHFDGVCNATTSQCECALGAHGALCETSPVANGRCDAFYNIPYFEFDGGDCCDSTCVSSPDYTCGEENDGFTNKGYPFCQLPPDRWQELHDSIINGAPLSLTGYSIAMSQAGTLLAVGEPEKSQVKLLDKDGSLWILRETLTGIPNAQLGLSVGISGGPAHWRNNPYFRAPLILAVGQHADDQPTEVFIYQCEKLCIQKDTLTNVNGRNGPEAYEIASDGRVVAYGTAEPGPVKVYEMTGDYYEGERVPRNVVDPSASSGSVVWAVHLSKHGDVMVVFETLPFPQKNVLRVFEWDGESYQPKGDGPLLETDAEILQRQIALSDDGLTVILGLSECPVRDIYVFVWDSTSNSWIPRSSPPMRKEESCVGRYRAWSVATGHHGLTVAAVAYPDSDIVTTYEWVEEAVYWRVIGQPIDAHYPGSETAIAMSGDGAHLAVGIPYAGLNEAGIAITYSLPISHCPIGESHHFRLSLTTDYEPENTRWSLEDASGKHTVETGGPYEFSTGTVVEEYCVDTVVCHYFTIYNTAPKPYGLDRPGRFDVFVDGEDVDRDSFSGRAKRLAFGDECLTCPPGKRMLRMMVRTCHWAEWQLVDDAGTTLISGSTDNEWKCTDPNGIDTFYWEEICIDEAKCYAFTVTDTTKDTMSNNQDSATISAAEESILDYVASNSSQPSESPRSSVEYLVLYDSDTVVASEAGIVGSATAVIGGCGMP